MTRTMAQLEINVRRSPIIEELSYTGIERESEYLELSKKRMIETVPEWGLVAKLAVAG
jgi:hypothetical protein